MRRTLTQTMLILLILTPLWGRTAPKLWSIHRLHPIEGQRGELENGDSKFAIGGEGARVISMNYIRHFPTSINGIDTITTKNGKALLIVGDNFVTTNGSGGILWTNETIKSHVVGDLDMDGYDEVILITDNWICAVDENSTPLWTEKNYIGGDKVYIGNITSPMYSLVICWKNNTNRVLYYNYTGEFLGNYTINVPVGQLDITHITHIGEYIIANNAYDGTLYWWRYGDTEANPLDPTYIYSTPAKNGEKLYSVRSDGESTELCIIKPVIGWVREAYPIKAAGDWRHIAYTSKELLYYDADSDGDLEFLIHNGSFVAFIDVSYDSGLAIQHNASVSLDDVSMIDGYVVILHDGRLRMYDLSLSIVCSMELYRVEGLTPPNPYVLCYGGYGNVYNISDDAAVGGAPSRVFIDAGWRIGARDTHIMFYQAWRVVDIYVDGIWEYVFDESINYAIPITDGFIVVWSDGSVSVFHNRYGLLWDDLRLSGLPIAGDYDEISNSLCMVLDNGDIEVISDISDITYYNNVTGVVLDSQVYSRNGSHYVFLVNASNDSIMLRFFSNASPIVVESISCVADMYLSSSAVGDIDGDGVIEVAYTLAMLNGSGARYIYVVRGEDEIFRCVEDTSMVGKSPQCGLSLIHI